MSKHNDLGPLQMRLRKLDRTSLDYLSILNFVGNEGFQHQDIDVFAILASEGSKFLSNHKRLNAFTKDLMRCLGLSAHGFSSFRHQTFFTAELRKRKIKGTPFHLLIYPNDFYASQWETPARVRSMLRISVEIYKRQGWAFHESTRASDAYTPYLFLQVLYEAFILFRCSNIRSGVLTVDVLRKIEFSCKNLTLEAYLKREGLTKGFNTNWHYITAHLRSLRSVGVSTEVVTRCLDIRRSGYEKLRANEIEAHLIDAFTYYDEMMNAVFVQ